MNADLESHRTCKMNKLSKDHRRSDKYVSYDIVPTTASANELVDAIVDHQRERDGTNDRTAVSHLTFKMPRPSFKLKSLI